MPQAIASTESEATESRSWPWLAEPHRLWSLWDMLEFFAPQLMQITSELWRTSSDLAISMGGHSEVGDAHRTRLEHLAQTIAELQKPLEALPLSAVLMHHFESLKDAANDGDALFFRHPEVLGIQFHSSLMVEMNNHLFFMVAADDKPLYQDPISWFESGKPVLKRFRRAEADIVGAGKCCALGQWTAVVFHAMRVVEHGLKKLARNARINISNLDSKEWGSILEKLDKFVVALRAQPQRTARLEARIQRYSEAMTHVRDFKDAWRKYAMHARKDYGELEARNILTNVKSFMRSLC